MCQTCWQEYGGPKIKNNNIELAVWMIGKVYAKHLSGGHLHIVLDDWNLENESLTFCEKQIEDDDLSDMIDGDYQTFKDIEHGIMAIFRQMSLDERASTLYWYDLHEFFIDKEP